MNIGEKAYKKITVAVPFPVYPPLSGGQSRVFHLYRNLSQWFDITLVSLTHSADEQRMVEISTGLRELRIPKSKEHEEKEVQLKQKAEAFMSHIALDELYPLTPKYVEALKELSIYSDVIISCHPFLFRAVKESSDGKPIWYDAQNVEYKLYKKMLPDNEFCHMYVEKLRLLEQECCQSSQLIMACSEADSNQFSSIYTIDPDRIIAVPNGVDTKENVFVGIEERLSAKVRTDMNDQFLALFMGSLFEPNVEALKYILCIAPKAPDITFIIMGSVVQAFEEEIIPENIKLLGLVDEEVKNQILRYADVALNPVTTGSGTNIKMLDYFSSGIPVISTATGARGLNIVHKQHVIISDLEGFLAAIIDVKNESKFSKENRVQQARGFVEDVFDWYKIAEKLVASIEEKSIFNEVIKKRTVIENNRPLLYGVKEMIGNRPLIIWGAGSGGIETRRLLNEQGINVHGFIDGDSKKWGQYIDKLPIYSPVVLDEKYSEDSLPYIIIGSTYAKDIKKVLQEKGYTHKKDFVERDFHLSFLFLW